VGIIALAAGLQAYLIAPAPAWQRIALVAGGLCLIIPGTVTDIVGLSTFAAVLLIQKARRR